MEKQYIVSKYVMAESVTEALKKAKKTPITEVYVHNAWLEKNKEHNMYERPVKKIGFKDAK